MKILVIQNRVYENIEDTLYSIRQNLREIDFTELDFVVLPEMFTTPYEYKYFESYKQNTSGEVIKFLKELAVETNCYVIGGTIPEAIDDKIYNTCFVFDRMGNAIAKYRKIHLFEVEYPNGETFSEKTVLSQGKKVVTFDSEFGKMGIMICFDIRFPEQAEKLMKAGAKVIFVPAAFNTFTGPLHWETTFRSRAIDNQLFMIGCSPCQDSYGEYKTYGHSIVVDPYGQVLKELLGNEGMMEADIDLEMIEEARKKIPIIKNKVKLED